ncbi:alkaline phosphatase PhoX [Aliikangiella maris]|uniref:Alkaline phosphatase PhoX n=2 Tax=Aliikangiella maris TaxID=3162458 RepID=A0ABV3MQX8_9GAMM
MTNLKLAVISSAIAMTTSVAIAGTEPFFNPLTQSSAVASPNHINEVNSPWQVPAGISQVNLTSMAEIEADMDQSVVRAPGAGTSASMWDMVAFDHTGNYIFIPHESPYGAGVTRYDIRQDKANILFSGDNSGQRGVDNTWANDFGAFDPATYTPYGTLILGEEWSGEGRVIEVLNPMAHPDDIEIREKQSFANVSQEGIRFGKKQKNVVYYVDEDRSGAIYKLVADDREFNSGQTFVLAVNDFDGVSSENYNSANNANATRTGDARWIPLTDRQGKPLTQQNPFENAASFRAGRLAADEVGATPYGRPEDVEVGILGNGREVLYFTATSEQAVYSVEMLRGNRAVVRVFASETGTPKNVGFPATTGKINSPDNLAQDAFGNIYIIEDAPNGSDIGGDIWFVRDANSDGVAESVDHFMSIQVNGAEATGMIFNPKRPTEFVVSIQHPSSTDIENNPNGKGDALWLFNIEDVVPPTCEKNFRYNRHSFYNGRFIRTCSSDWDFNYVRKLKRQARHDR